MTNPAVAPALSISFRRTLPGGTVEYKPPRRLTEGEFRQFCADNDRLRVEQTSHGNLIIMPPLTHDNGVREGIVVGLVFAWWQKYQRGEAHGPNTGFTLPDSSVRMADVSWTGPEKINVLTASERRKFARLVPDFVIEMRSSSDRLAALKRKMTDTWIRNGVRLAWLIDPVGKKAYIYRADGATEVLDGFDQVLTGENVCPGLEVDLKKLPV